MKFVYPGTANRSQLQELLQAERTGYANTRLVNGVFVCENKKLVIGRGDVIRHTDHIVILREMHEALNSTSPIQNACGGYYSLQEDDTCAVYVGQALLEHELTDEQLAPPEAQEELVAQVRATLTNLILHAGYMLPFHKQTKKGNWDE